jgi:RNA polymerase sigma factor (sigma-70 family)
MATRHAGKVLPGFRRAVLLRGGAGLSDGQLLECYLDHREETAFAALVRRHGPMVWGVCRRVLPSYHDAEDAFQATFLVLVRKAASVMPREKVANWLYGVAYQTALKARAVAARRGARERQMTSFPEPALPEPERRQELGPLLDQELTRLPDLYRVPVVLCDLEGLTYREAARQLGCPEGTLAARLARARALLAKRLARHGLLLSGGALAVALSVNEASACVPAAVVTATVQAAGLFAGPAAAGVISAPVLALTEGVLQTMLVNKIKMAAGALLLVGVLGAGVGAGGVVAQSYGPGRGFAPGGPEKGTSPAVALNLVADDDEAADDDVEKLQRALEKQRRLLDEKEEELARLKAKLKEARSGQGTATPTPGSLDDEVARLKQMLKEKFKFDDLKKLKDLEELKNLKDLPELKKLKDLEELKKLKDLPELKKLKELDDMKKSTDGRDKDAERREMLKRAQAEYERILKDEAAELAKSDKMKKLRDGSKATDKETDPEKLEKALAEIKKLLKGGDAADMAKSLAELAAAKAGKDSDAGPRKERREKEQPTTSVDIEALKRLEEVVQRWADGKRAIEPEEMKKVLATLHKESGKKKSRSQSDIKEQNLQEKDAALAEMKRALEELRRNWSADRAPSKRGADQPAPRKRNADVEELQKLLREQQDLLRQKEDEVKKLQEFLKKFPKGKEEDESPDDE